jgi:hypothetical protein
MDMPIQAEMSDVMSKVNAWALARETDLLAVKTQHKSFLDTHSGAPCRPLPAWQLAVVLGLWR